LPKKELKRQATIITEEQGSEIIEEFSRTTKVIIAG